MKKNLLLLILCFFAFVSYGQIQNAAGVGAGFSSGGLNSSAIMEARSTAKGFLVPRMTTTQRNTISSPATSLLIFNTTTGKYNYYNGSAWTDFGGSQDLPSVLTINPTATSGSNIINLDYVNGQYELTAGGTEQLIVEAGTAVLISQSGANTTQIGAINGLLDVNQATSGNATHITADSAIANTNISFPAKSAGNYTVAMTSDITGGGGTVSTVTGTSPIVITSTPTTTPNVTVNNAAADNTTFGVSTFLPADFNSSAGAISLDYTNGQSASTSQKGYLTNTDWNTFNGKQSALGFTPENVANKITSSLTASTTDYPASSLVKSVTDANTAAIALKANTASPTFTGTVTVPNGSVLGTPASVNLANATFPTLNQNTTGTAANLSGTPALPNGTTATTQSASDNSTKLATTAYVDGINTKKVRFSGNTPTSALTGTTTETQMLKLTMPIGTFSLTDFIDIEHLRIVKTTATSTVTWRIKISTSSTMPTGNTDRVAVFTDGTGARTQEILRTFWQNGGNLTGVDFTTSLNSDIAIVSTTLSTMAFNNTTTQYYFYVSAQLTNSADSVYLANYEITN